jgi:hypothetical protein
LLLALALALPPLLLTLLLTLLLLLLYVGRQHFYYNCCAQLLAASLISLPLQESTVLLTLLLHTLLHCCCIQGGESPAWGVHMWLRASAIELHLLDDPTEAWLSTVYPLWQRSLAERELRSLRLRRRCKALENTEPPPAAAAASAALHAAADAAAAARYVRERRAAIVAAASTSLNTTTSNSSSSSSGGGDAPAACLAKISIGGLAVSLQPPVSGAARCWELLQKLDEGSLQLSSSSSSSSATGSSGSAIAIEDQRFSTITKAQVHAYTSIKQCVYSVYTYLVYIKRAI